MPPALMEPETLRVTAPIQFSSYLAYLPSSLRIVYSVPDRLQYDSMTGVAVSIVGVVVATLCVDASAPGSVIIR